MPAVECHRNDSQRRSHAASTRAESPSAIICNTLGRVLVLVLVVFLKEKSFFLLKCNKHQHKHPA